MAMMYALVAAFSLFLNGRVLVTATVTIDHVADPSATGATITVTTSDGNTFTMNAATIDNSGMISQDPAATMTGTSHELTAASLTPATQYTVSLANVQDGSTSPIAGGTASIPFCTLAAPVTSLAQDAMATTGTDIVVTFTQPTGTAHTITATFDDGSPDTLTTSDTSHTFDTSNAVLTPGQSGTCKIIVAGAAPCDTIAPVSEEITCYTKSEVQFRTTEATASSLEIEAYIDDSRTKDFIMGANPTISNNPSTSAASPVTLDPNDNSNAHASFKISADNLDAATEYTFTLVSLSEGSGTPVGLTDTAPTYMACTKPQGVTNLQITETDTEITLTWTNPTPGPEEIKVEIGSQMATLQSNTLEEYTMQISTPLSDDAECKVITGVTSGSCMGQEYEVVEKCPRAAGSIVIPHIVPLCLVYLLLALYD